MRTNFDILYDGVMRMLNEDGVPAGAMGDAGYVDASVHDPGSPDAIYALASGVRMSKTPKHMRRKSMRMKRKKSV
jgi:hypothetical protein